MASGYNFDQYIRLCIYNEDTDKREQSSYHVELVRRYLV